MSSPTASPGGRWPLVAGLAALAGVGQLYGLYRPSAPPSPLWFPYADKVEHALGFALPVALVLVAGGLRARSCGGGLDRSAWTLVLAVAAGHAVVSELVQAAFYTYRSGDPLDVLADLTGVVLGSFGARAVLRKPAPVSPVVPTPDRTSPTAR